MGPLDWVFGTLLDFFAERLLDGDGGNDTLGNFDPRDMENAHYQAWRGSDIVYTSNENNSWYVDQHGDGSIDAHVVLDGMGYYWADVGNGYINTGQDPSGGQ